MTECEWKINVFKGRKPHKFFADNETIRKALCGAEHFCHELSDPTKKEMEDPCRGCLKASLAMDEMRGDQ